MTRKLRLALVAALAVPSVGSAQDTASAARAADSVVIRIADVELAAAVRMLARYLDRPVLYSGNSSARVTFETPGPVARSDVARLLRGIVDGYGLEMIDDTASGAYRIRGRAPVRTEPAAAAAQPRARQGSLPELFVLPLNHVRADEVSKTLSALFGLGSREDVSSSRSPATLGASLRDNLVPPEGNAIPGPTPRLPGQLPASLAGNLTIVPDARANTLLIRAERADFELVGALVEQIDVRPLQVLIEVLIAEVRRDRSLGLSTEGTLGETPLRGTNMTASGAMGTDGLGDFALRVMGIGGADATATLSMEARQGNVRILSRPVILAANNEQASILVGSQRPFVQVQRALPTDGATRDQVVQYKEVGTRLTVTPAISIDGSVHLEVMQEISSATAETAFDAPVISSRSVQTQLIVRDGQTVVLGGLADRQRESTSQGIPFLSAIPILGGLFGSNQRRTTETELFVFLKPQIIRTDDDAMRLSTPLQDRVSPSKP